MSSVKPNPQVWSEKNLDNPHRVIDKAARVEQMFDAIAPSYDLNNRLHSLWQDQVWRRNTVKLAQVQSSDTVLDVACGTGDLTMAFAKACPKRALGLDFTVNMLNVAQKKRPEHSPVPIHYFAGDAMSIPLADASVDIVSIAFGIRNVVKPAVAIQEFYRVLRPGGRLLILEFSLPKNKILKALYNFYFYHILPKTATLIARDKSGAYRYLPQSVNTFIDRKAMIEMMSAEGFTDTSVTPQTFGISVIYKGLKK